MVLLNIFSLKRKTPANIAKQRLKNIISKNLKNKNITNPYFLAQLKLDLIQVINKYIHKPHVLTVRLEQKENDISLLRCKIIIFEKKSKII
ncbi:cell division topological specificity factor MinE [Candidatus Blochmannia ocreatus (nom. nud.)]|uniref:Cell division topological specificity factor n=1 Tax=Candidatus Blochmannia ocreatus (nom. nud.) TaxID=251538 RepID=A0ABY4SVG7_9ENTR|nr:cell division topological specificity factor MinE [Candidatus Blochmannia ocreatus]URJ24940.1 cell division topological specificity factor MinE [Candidatus Blochmannia ocreatus]